MKRTIAFLLALTVSASLSAQIFITGFGTDDFEDAGSAPALFPAETAIRFEGDTTGSLLGIFAPVDITGYTAALAFTATVAVNPFSDFQLSLFSMVEEDVQEYVYAGNWGDFVTGVESTAILAALPGQAGPFDFTQVFALAIYFDAGFEGAPIDVTLDTLTALAAVPEPSAAAFLAGLAGLGFVVARRRRKV